MYKFKKNIALAAVLSVTAALFSSCAEKEGDTVNTASESTAETTAAVQREPLKIIYDEIKTEFGTVDLSDYPLTASNVPADYESVYEAENAEMAGGAAAYAIDTASGGSAVNGVNSGKNGDSLIFTVNAEYDGFYDLNFICKAGDNSKRENYVHLDGEKVGSIICRNNGIFGDSYLKNVHLTAGEHKIAIVPSWG